MKDISHLPMRSEEDARTSWCPCVNPASLKRNRLDSLMSLAPYALRSLVIQHNKTRNWKHRNKHERTETRIREKCRPMPGATCHPIARQPAPTAHAPVAPTGTPRPKAQQMQTNQG